METNLTMTSASYLSTLDESYQALSTCRDQKGVYLLNQTPIPSVFKHSEGSNNRPGGTDNECCSWAYLSTFFIIMNCGFDP